MWTPMPTAERALRQSLVFVALLGPLLSPALLLAEPPDERPSSVEDLSREQKRRFLEFLRAGNGAYADGEFEKALPFFERAYEILPKPVIHFKMAVCHERAGHPDEALRFYRRYLEQRPDSPKRGRVQASIEKLRQRVRERSMAEVEIESNPSNAKVFVRTGGAERRELEPRGRTPVTLEVVPGTVELTLEKEGYETLRETIRVEPGERARHRYTFSDRPRSRRRGGGQRGPERGRRSNTVALTATIVGGMGALVGGTLYGVGVHCAQNRKGCSRGLFNTAVVGSYVGGGLGIAGLGTGAIIGLTDNSGGRTKSSPPEVRLVARPPFVGLHVRF